MWISVVAYVKCQQTLGILVDLVQHCSSMQCNMVGLVALDLVLRIGLAASMHMTFVIGVARVHFDDLASHVTGLRVPAHMVADFKAGVHGCSRSRDIAILKEKRCQV